MSTAAAAVNVATLQSALDISRELNTVERTRPSGVATATTAQYQHKASATTMWANNNTSGVVSEEAARLRRDAAAALLDRWEAEVDNRGRMYYFNRFRKQSVWQEEAEKLPPGSLVGRDDSTGQHLRASQLMAYKKLRSIQANATGPQPHDLLMSRDAPMSTLHGPNSQPGTDNEAIGGATAGAIPPGGVGVMRTNPHTLPFAMPLPSTPPLSECDDDDVDEDHAPRSSDASERDCDDDDERSASSSHSDDEDDGMDIFARRQKSLLKAGIVAGTGASNGSGVTAGGNEECHVSGGVAAAAAAAIAVRSMQQPDALSGTAPAVWISTYDERGFKYYFDLTTNRARWEEPDGDDIDVHSLQPPNTDPPPSTVDEARSSAATRVDGAARMDGGLNSPSGRGAGTSATTVSSSLGVHNGGIAPVPTNLRLWKINNGLASSGLLGVPYNVSGKWKMVLDEIVAQSRDASFESYAMKHFKIKTVGKETTAMARDRAMRATSVSITTALSVIGNPRLDGEAVRIFKLILEFTNGWRRGETGNGSARRDSSSGISDVGRTGQLPTTRDIELARAILSNCVVHGGPLIDEAYCQLVKQATDSPHARSCLRCWQLLYCFTVTVIPSTQKLACAVLNYMQKATHDMRLAKPCRSAAESCHLRLVNTLMYGVRGYLPSHAEISSALIVPSNTACFSCTLDEIMYMQHQTKPCLGLSYPEGLHAIVSAFDESGSAAYNTRSLFHQDAEPESLAAVIEDFAAGNYACVTNVSPHVLAGLMKTYLKEMALPIIPSRMYAGFTDAASDTKRIVDQICALPEVNRLCLSAVIRILAKVCGPQHVHRTLVNVETAAAIVAPCVMHSPSTSGKQHRESQVKLEQALLKRVINSFVKYLYDNERTPIAMALLTGTGMDSTANTSSGIDDEMEATLSVG